MPRRDAVDRSSATRYRIEGRRIGSEARPYIQARRMYELPGPRRRSARSCTDYTPDNRGAALRSRARAVRALLSYESSGRFGRANLDQKWRG